jgi:hypothetical protein
MSLSLRIYDNSKVVRCWRAFEKGRLLRHVQSENLGGPAAGRPGAATNRRCYGCGRSCSHGQSLSKLGLGIFKLILLQELSFSSGSYRAENDCYFDRIEYLTSIHQLHSHPSDHQSHLPTRTSILKLHACKNHLHQQEIVWKSEKSRKKSRQRWPDLHRKP